MSTLSRPLWTQRKPHHKAVLQAATEGRFSEAAELAAICERADINSRGVDEGSTSLAAHPDGSGADGQLTGCQRWSRVSLQSCRTMVLRRP
jgi:hypothetical protein